MNPLLIVAALSLGGTPPKCDAAALNEAVTAVAKYGVDPIALASLTADTLLRACGPALSDRERSALNLLLDLSPVDFALQYARALAPFVGHEEWSRACPETHALQRAASDADTQGTFFDACHWEPLGLGTRAEFSSARGGPIAVVFFQSLLARGVSRDAARTLARALGGLGSGNDARPAPRRGGRTDLGAPTPAKPAAPAGAPHGHFGLGR